MIGSLIGNYKVISVIGEGGMGTVYKAFDIKLERYVAIKVLNAQTTNKEQFIERFKREAKNQAKLIHSNIVPVYGFTDESQVLGIVMEYVEGETLEHLIGRKGRLELSEALNILKQILQGVSYAHSKSYIHRDIKPSNIIISKDGYVKIMDFGISKALFDKGITKTGTKIGTLLYMSPEQVRAEEPTKQSDIYSIGITFFEMLIGKTPFDLGTEFEIMEAHIKKNPSRISQALDTIPPEIDKIVAKALDKNPMKRYLSCDEFIEELENVFSKYQTPKTKAEKTQNDKKVKSARIQKIKITFFGLLALAVFGFITYYGFYLVSDFWETMKGRRAAPSADTTINYRSNPSFVLKSNWKYQETNTTLNLNGIHFIDDSTGFVVGQKGTLLKTTSSGSVWETIVFPDSSILNDIKFLNSTNGVIVGEFGKIFTTSDSGNSWQQVNKFFDETIFSLYAYDRNTLFAVGDKGLIIRSVDAGKTWERLNSGTNNLLFSLYFSTNKVGYAVGWNGTILKTEDRGDSWRATESFTPQYLRDVIFVDEKTGFICGGGGEIYKTTNAGKDWNQLTSNLFSGLSGILFSDKNNGLVISQKGEINQTSDGGQNWTSNHSGRYYSLSRLEATPSGNIYIIGFHGTILTNK